MARSKKTTTKRTTKKTSKKELKKPIQKMNVEVKPTFTLTEEQYDNLFRMISWSNPLTQLDMISEMQETTLLEIGYKIGIVYNEFQKMLNECETILRDIDKRDEDIEQDDYEWDNLDDDYES